MDGVSCERWHAVRWIGEAFAENPPSRSRRWGVWSRFYSRVFSWHCALWDTEDMEATCRNLGLVFIHTPMCWFAHEDGSVCSVPQHYTTFAISPQLWPALGFMSDLPCTHRSLAPGAGIDESTG